MLRDPPMEIAEDSPWVRLVLAAAQAIVPAETTAVHYGTDASKFADVGIPSVVIGPGDIAQAHTAEEWVSVEEVRSAVEVYRGVLEGAAGAAV